MQLVSYRFVFVLGFYTKVKKILFFFSSRINRAIMVVEKKLKVSCIVKIYGGLGTYHYC